MARRLIALAFGLVFGFLLSWGTLTHPDTIRRMLLLQDAYLWLMFATAVPIGFVGIRLLRRGGGATGISILRPERRHLTGSVLFGLGWAVADTCPGPVAAQLGQGLVWSLFTITGIGIGIELYARRQRRAAREALAARPAAVSQAS
jgi:uncharacterized membrane protein YedE/YeeE